MASKKPQRGVARRFHLDEGHTELADHWSYNAALAACQHAELVAAAPAEFRGWLDCVIRRVAADGDFQQRAFLAHVAEVGLIRAVLDALARERPTGLRDNDIEWEWDNPLPTFFLPNPGSRLPFARAALADVDATRRAQEP